MKRLNELTMAQFIDISCGDYASLCCKDSKEAENQAVRLIYEYKNIVNPSGVRAALLDKENDVKLKGKLILLHLCEALCKLGYHKEALDGMRSYLPTYSKDGEELEKDITYKIREANFVRKRMIDCAEHSEKHTESEIRSSFDSEIAFIMTYFKMPLDVSTVNAAVYANIVSQAHREIKHQMARKGR